MPDITAIRYYPQIFTRTRRLGTPSQPPDTGNLDQGEVRPISYRRKPHEARRRLSPSPIDAWGKEFAVGIVGSQKGRGFGRAKYRLHAQKALLFLLIG